VNTDFDQAKVEAVAGQQLTTLNSGGFFLMVFAGHHTVFLL